MTASTSTLAAAPLAAPAFPVARRIYWALRRELMESRSVWIAPLAAAALFLLGFLVGMYRLPEAGVLHLPQQGASPLHPVLAYGGLASAYDMLGGMLMLTMMLVSAFYCLDALYGERRDRSTLFWKSLPVSDRMTVLVKAAIPLVFLPLFCFVVAVAAHCCMLTLVSTVRAVNGLNVASLWDGPTLVKVWLLLLYHLLTAHALGVAPIYGWFLFVSAWARRAPWLWAFLPPIGLCYLEKIAFGTTYLTAMLGSRVYGNGKDAMTMAGTFPTDVTTYITPLRYLSSPDIWLGFAITAGFLWAAMELRRRREPI